MKNSKLLSGGIKSHEADSAVSNACNTLILVISLENAELRRIRFTTVANLQNAELKWSFFPAWTSLSPKLQYDARRAIAARGRELHSGELACFSSHFEAWISFLASDAEQLVVLEDDVQLDWDFLNRIVQRSLQADGIHYLKLFSKNMTPYHVVSNDFHGRWLLNCRGFAYGMQAYIITRQAAQIFVDHCGRLVTRPIDDELDRSWRHGVPNLTVFPFPAFEIVGPSTIGADRDRFLPLEPRLKLERYLCQVQERLLRIRQRSTGYGLISVLPAYPSRRFGRSHIQRELQ